jgi:hypothetical protein
MGVVGCLVGLLRDDYAELTGPNWPIRIALKLLGNLKNSQLESVCLFMLCHSGKRNACPGNAW